MRETYKKDSDFLTDDSCRYGAVIVAAGMSTRMKQFKQLMRVGNMTLAERVIVNFQNAGVRNIVMVTGFNADELEKNLKKFGVVFIRNEAYETTQMFDSARLGIDYMKDRCDRLFFCPADVPFFTDSTVQAEMECNAKVIVPTYREKDGHPLLIDRSVFSHILSHSGENGLKGAYESLPEGSILRIPVADEGAVLDADTREDYQRLVELHNRRILHADQRVRISGSSPFFGPGTLTLLEQIQSSGSVRGACTRTGISYSKGWRILRNCETNLGYRIVERQNGGRNGGEAFLTEKGRLLIRAYKELSENIDRYTELRFKEVMGKYGLTESRNT